MNTRMPVDEAVKAARCVEKAIPKEADRNKETLAPPTGGDEAAEMPPPEEPSVRSALARAVARCILPVCLAAIVGAVMVLQRCSS